MHSKGRIHADFKPLNAVRVASTWQLIDMDVSCAVGKGFGTKAPSSGYIPPELAEVLLNAMDEETGEIEAEKLSKYTASLACDLWSVAASNQTRMLTWLRQYCAVELD